MSFYSKFFREEGLWDFFKPKREVEIFLKLQRINVFCIKSLARLNLYNYKCVQSSPTTATVTDPKLHI